MIIYSYPLPQKALAIIELETILPDLRILSNTRWDHIQKSYFVSLDMGNWNNKSYKLGISGFTLAAGRQVEKLQDWDEIRRPSIYSGSCFKHP